jgi:hypothetical protein
MKKIIIVILISFFLNSSKAQDTLTMRNGENIPVKVIEVGTLEVKYKKLDNLNGPTFSVLKSNLSKIIYENGTKEDYGQFIDNEFAHGQKDASEYYHGYKTAGTSTLVATAIPYAGAMIGFAYLKICYATVPNDENLGYPDYNLMKNPEYARGYIQKAQKIKKQKVLNNFLLGLVLNFGLSTAFFMDNK